MSRQVATPDILRYSWPAVNINSDVFAYLKRESNKTKLPENAEKGLNKPRYRLPDIREPLPVARQVASQRRALPPGSEKLRRKFTSQQDAKSYAGPNFQLVFIE